MNLLEELSGCKSVFLDTAPIIYYIEAHAEYAPLVKEVINYLKAGDLTAFTSVITITEVLPKPVLKKPNAIDREIFKVSKKRKEC